MKAVITLVCTFLLARQMSAQVSMVDCVKNIFTKADSVSAAGKNPFEEWTVCVLGKPMPAFAARSISGDSVEMSRFRGKVVVINFWFIDCAPCIAEIPAMNNLAREYSGRNVELLAMTWESPKRIKEEFLVKHKLDFRIIPVGVNVIGGLIASGFPTTFIIDGDGIIRSAWNGGATGEAARTEFYDKAKPVIDQLLSKK